MNCSEFQHSHSALLDQELSHEDLVRAQRHLSECQTCATHHASVRRAMMVFRSIPQVEISHGFAERLNRRLAEKPTQIDVGTAWRTPLLFFFATAASLMLIAGALVSTDYLVGASDGNPAMIRSDMAAADRSADAYPSISAATTSSLVGESPRSTIGAREETVRSATVASSASSQSQLLSPAMAASLSGALPVWPAFLMAEQAAMQAWDADFYFTTSIPR